MNNATSRRVLALAALTVTAVAAKACPDQQPPAGMKAFKDPVTGELTAPTAQQAAELEAAKQSMAPPKARKGAPVAFALPQGGVGMKLDESHMLDSAADKTKPTVKPPQEK